MVQSGSPFSSYFDSYARKSPLRHEWIAKTGSRTPGLTSLELADSRNADGSPAYISVYSANFPKLYRALMAECAFRQIDVPACYIDTGPRCRLGWAEPAREAIFVEKAAYDLMTEQELRALVAHEVKHLYQGAKANAKEAREAEYDCDRAAVSSTDYATIRSYVHKSVTLMIDKKLPALLRPLAKAFHQAFPNLLAENFWFRLDSDHPSPAARMSAMKVFERTHVPAPQRAALISYEREESPSSQPGRQWGAYLETRKQNAVDSGLIFQAK